MHLIILLLKNTTLPVKMPTLIHVLEMLTKTEKLHQFGNKKSKLKVIINSFSYKNGIPADDSGHGGGFVFDCRSLHNPGRYEKYKALTGKDKEVIDFLRNEPEIYEFMNHVYGLVDNTIANFIKRDFTNLQVNFGCTGGQHRSVFCANMLAEHLKKGSVAEVELKHTALEKLNIHRS
jgi:RNase adaptor protein for sRNA GlmZ degradation